MPAGPSEYSFVIAADDAYKATTSAVATFRAAVAASGVADVAETRIIHLHAAPSPVGRTRLLTISQLIERVRAPTVGD
jgi:hypothetical protein